MCVFMYMCVLMSFLSEVSLFNRKQYHMGSQNKVQKMFNDSNHTSRQFKIGAFVISRKSHATFQEYNMKIEECIYLRN